MMVEEGRRLARVGFEDGSNLIDTLEIVRRLFEAANASGKVTSNRSSGSAVDEGEVQPPVQKVVVML
ncbi:hypothetical protein EYW49_22370 [Siculibacillus lacustris]|uniref:Uncharacterized protein n=1 Tax=Siculibacillus lacustris TaxID=1549641 RepID=A0A4Q9VCM0_9HYPH|nr:hypothetical protein [Siculibacillus lacustris]TBW32260.1 hypothetical protein EYW49_22370 [Siculibacillus lacustris]